MSTAQISAIQRRSIIMSFQYITNFIRLDIQEKKTTPLLTDQ